MFRLTVCFVLAAGAAWGQAASDEALAECQSRYDSFTEVKKCLPETDVALNMLAAVGTDEYFGSAGKKIADACTAVNKNSAGTWVCTRVAIRDAVELVEMVGSIEKIEDVRARGVADDEVYQRLLLLEDEFQSKFDVSIWGGGVYFPLK